MVPRRVPGRPWVGWGAAKGMIYRPVVHSCPRCGDVVLGDIDETRAWLRANALAPASCWNAVLDGALRVDQAIWTRAFAAGERAERARLRANVTRR